MNPRRRFFRTRRLPYRWRRAVVLLIAVAILIVARWYGWLPEPQSPESLAEGVYQVERVVDGDTLLLVNQARVRLQGVDTPETVHPDRPVEPYGPEATQFTRQLIAEAGDRVRLQFDRERVDRYGRFLAYVWVGDRMLNEELVRRGLATAEIGFRYSDAMKTRFVRAEDEAKDARRGIWSEEPWAGNL